MIRGITGGLAAAALGLGGLGAGCGSSGDSASDAAVTFDAPPPDALVADADPNGPLRCIGQDLPTTAVDPIGLTGRTITISGFAAQALADVDLAGFQEGVAEPVATTTSDFNGNFLIGFTSNGVPVDGFLKATKEGFVDTFLYPPAPLAQSTPNALVVMATTSLINNTLGALLGEEQDFDNAMLLVVVTDCDQQPIRGATVTTSPGGHVYYNAGGSESEQGVPVSSATSTDYDGIAYVFNVSPGDVTVDAEVGGLSLREHVVLGRSNALTSTLVIP